MGTTGRAEWRPATIQGVLESNKGYTLAFLPPGWNSAVDPASGKTYYIPPNGLPTSDFPDQNPDVFKERKFRNVIDEATFDRWAPLPLKKPFHPLDDEKYETDERPHPLDC